MAKGYIMRESKKKIYVRETATAEERKKIEEYVKLGWVAVPCKPKEEKEVVPHTVTKEFNISYDEVRKEDMVKYIKEFVEDEKALKNFAIAAHKTVKGEKSVDKDGNPKYNQIAAKRYFYETFFPKKWEEIKVMLENRKFKTKAAKERNAIQQELLDLLKG